MWNIEKLYRWSYLQSRSRDTDVKKIRLPKGKGIGWNELGDWDWRTYGTDRMDTTDNEWEPPVEHKERPGLCRDLSGKEIKKDGTHVYV